MGPNQKILLRLYKTYIRSIFEYGCVAYVHLPNSTIDILQKIQNRAIRIALRLPRYVSLKVLHENSCLPFVKERLCQLGLVLLNKMKVNNPLIHQIVEDREAENLRTVRQHGLKAVKRSHCSPLDIFLPAQRPFLTSS